MLYLKSSSFLAKIASHAAHAGQSQYFAPAALISLQADGAFKRSSVNSRIVFAIVKISSLLLTLIIAMRVRKSTENPTGKAAQNQSPKALKSSQIAGQTPIE